MISRARTCVVYDNTSCISNQNLTPIITMNMRALYSSNDVTGLSQYSSVPYMCPQDSTLSHLAEARERPAGNLRDVWSTSLWSPSSPVAPPPRNYGVWGAMKSKVRPTPQLNLASSKAAGLKKWMEMSVCEEDTCDCCPRRLLLQKEVTAVQK